MGVKADLHIDGGQGAVGDGTADGASEGESGVEGEARELLGVELLLSLLLESVELVAAGRGRRCGRCSTHCAGVVLQGFDGDNLIAGLMRCWPKIERRVDMLARAKLVAGVE